MIWCCSGDPTVCGRARSALADIRRAVVEVEFTPVPAAVAALLAEDAGVPTTQSRDTDDTEVADDSADGRDAG